MTRAGILDEFWRIVRFAGIGGIATLVHFSVCLGVLYSLGADEQIANLAGFGVALSISFLGHYHFTFKSERGHAKALPRFLLVALCAYLVSAAVIALLASLSMSPLLQVFFGAGVIPVASYFANRLLVF